MSRLVILSILLFFNITVQASTTINFKFIDIENKAFELQSYAGKWVIVNFFAPWCPLCWIEVPTLNKLNAQPHIVVIGVAMDYGTNDESIPGIIRQHNMKFERYVLGNNRRSPKAAFFQVGPVDFFPTSYLYDPKGNVVMFIPGQIREHVITKFINSYK